MKKETKEKLSEISEKYFCRLVILALIIAGSTAILLEIYNIKLDRLYELSFSTHAGIIILVVLSIILTTLVLALLIIHIIISDSLLKDELKH